MPQKLGFIDVGARGGALTTLSPFLDRLDLVLVEPEISEVGRLATAGGDGARYKVIGAALGHIDGRMKLHETTNPHCSSVLKVNHDFLDPYNIHPHFADATVSEVPCSRYDTLFLDGGLPVPHLIKIDTQGFEYQVLLGFGALLHRCLAIELETHFYELYRGQKLFSDIIALLSQYDFALRKISNGRSPDMNGDNHFDQDIVEVDATFSKKKTWLAAANSETKADFELVRAVFDLKPYP